MIEDLKEFGVMIAIGTGAIVFIAGCACAAASPFVFVGWIIWG